MKKESRRSSHLDCHHFQDLQFTMRYSLLKFAVDFSAQLSYYKSDFIKA